MAIMYLRNKSGGGVLLYATNCMNIVKITKIDVDAYVLLNDEIKGKKRSISSA